MLRRTVFEILASALLWLLGMRQAAESSACPACGSMRLECTRASAEACEYRCADCGQVHTRKPGDPHAYAFFPADVERMRNVDIPPLWGG